MSSLSAAPQQTPAIRRERAFIEATSRLCSFRLDSRPGIPLTPIELRHAPDRLAYVSRLLASNDSAHRHPDMVLSLVHGLGYPPGGKDEVRALAMLADAAIGAGAYPLAAEQCARAVRAVEALRRTAARLADKGRGKEGGDEARRDADTAADHAWRACLALGKSAWADDAARLEALGQALTLCPPERIQDLLPTWTVLERQVAQDALRTKRAEDGAASGAASSSGGRGAGTPGGGGGLTSSGGEAARAAASAAAAGAAKVSHFLAAAAAANNNNNNNKPPPAPAPSRGAASSPDAPTSPTRGAAHGGAPPPPPPPPPQGVQHLASETAAAASYTMRRAAAFLQGPHAGGGRAQGDLARSPTAATFAARTKEHGDAASPTAPRRAELGAPAGQARPARSPSPPSSRFASALAGLAHDDDDDEPPRAVRPAPAAPAAARAGGGGGGGFGFKLGDKLTAGVGWLIGADELLEREKEEEEFRRKRAASQTQAQAQEPRGEEKEDGEGEGADDDDWGW